MEHDAPLSDDDGRACDVDLVGVLVEGTFEPVQLGEEAFLRVSLAVIDGRTGGDGVADVGDEGIRAAGVGQGEHSVGAVPAQHKPVLAGMAGWAPWPGCSRSCSGEGSFTR